MLSRMGINDNDIALQLTSAASRSLPHTAILAAEALWALGTYNAAAELYTSFIGEQSCSEFNQVHYILCLI